MTSGRRGAGLIFVIFSCLSAELLSPKPLAVLRRMFPNTLNLKDRVFKHRNANPEIER